MFETWPDAADLTPEYPYRSKLEVRLLLSAPDGARSSHKTVEIYRRADRLCAAVGRERHAGGRRLSTAWRVGGNLLHMEEEVRQFWRKRGICSMFEDNYQRIMTLAFSVARPAELAHQAGGRHPPQSDALPAARRVLC